MKNFKNIFAVVGIVLLLAGFATAETIRQGGDRIAFNQVNSVTKTSAYTVVAADSEVKVTNSSADIVITLPTISDLRPGTTAYKILKTDATAYVVTVTPATGDTIGGESTRKLTYQNAYMVISMGPNNDWQVDFESAYVVEDYESGTVKTYGAQNFAKTEVVTATNVITASECGTTYFLNSATEFASTLPAISTVSAGCKFEFFVRAAPSGASYTVITGNSLENVIIGGTVDRATNGTGSYQAAGDTITFADGSAVVGDYVRLMSDGTSFYMTGVSNVTAGITTTQAD